MSEQVHFPINCCTFDQWSFRLWSMPPHPRNFLFSLGTFDRMTLHALFLCTIVQKASMQTFKNIIQNKINGVQLTKWGTWIVQLQYADNVNHAFEAKAIVNLPIISSFAWKLDNQLMHINLIYLCQMYNKHTNPVQHIPSWVTLLWQWRCLSHARLTLLLNYQAPDATYML